MAGDTLTLVLFAVRIALNASALLLAGLALHSALGITWNENRWTLVACITATLVCAIIARLAVLTAQMGDTSVPTIDLLPLAWIALGSSTLAFIAGGAVILAGLILRIRPVAFVGAVVLSAGFGLTGHTQGLSDPGLAPATAGAHALLAAFWIAAPLSLYPASAVETSVLHHRLKRFSAVAVIAIPVLFVLGLWLAWLLTGGFGRLLTTAYGQLLLAKLAAATGALGLGAVNQRWITAAVAADARRGKQWLRRSLSAEALLFTIAILAVSAATTLTGAEG